MSECFLMLPLQHQRGRDGEAIAAAFLRFKGAEIVALNWRAGGRIKGEVDIIAREGEGARECLCFVEVKTRSRTDFGAPQEAVNANKQKALARVALAYIQQHELWEQTYRFDIVEVWLLPNQKPRVNWIKDAFSVRD